MHSYLNAYFKQGDLVEEKKKVTVAQFIYFSIGFWCHTDDLIG